MKKTRTWLRRQGTALSMHLTLLAGLGVLAASMAKSDMGAGAPAAAPPAPPAGGAEPAAAPPPAAGAPPQQAAPAGDRPLSEWEKDELVAHAQKLKDENVKYKDRFRPWEQTFDGVRTEDAEMFRDFIGKLRSGNPQLIGEAAAWMRSELDQMSPAQAAAVQAAADDAAGPGEEFDPFDRASIEKMIDDKAAALVDERLSAREQAQQQQQQTAQLIGEMNTHVAGLGEKLGIPDFKDPKSLLSTVLYQIATDDPELQTIADPMERLTAAADKVHLQRATWAKDMLQSKSEDADSPTTPPAGEAPSGKKAPETFEDARKSAMSRLSKSEPGT